MLFIDANSNVDKKALQTYVLGELTELKKATEAVMGGVKRSEWNKIRDAIARWDDNNKEKALEVIDDLFFLPNLISSWIKDSVETEQRFEFFVLSKAEEVAGGDEKHDYYWALQIRHDQLVGLVRVLHALLPKLEEFKDMSLNQLTKDPVFVGLMEYSVEDQVYLEAEKIHKERQKMVGK